MALETAVDPLARLEPAFRFPAVVEARGAMGTRFEIVLPGEDHARLRAAAEAALDEVERLEAQLSLYREESELSGLNAGAAAGPVRVEPRLFALLEEAVRIARETGGAFDPTVAPLVRAWGFAGGGGHPADPASVAAAREATGFHLLELDRRAVTIRFRRPGVELDLGAIGKGYALERAVETLEDAGIGAALLHAGTSSIQALGAPPGERAWPVGIRDPRATEEDAPAAVATLRDTALSVSAPHGRAFREGDRLYGHVLDPRSGEPARSALLAAVRHRSATLTDALSTALLVLGADGIELLSARFPDAALLVIDPEGQVHRAGEEGAFALPGEGTG